MRSLALVAIVAGFCLVPAAWADTRTWRSNDGRFTVEAELVQVDETLVHLKRKDGRVVQVPLERLSAADREFLKTRKTDAAAKPPAVRADPRIEASTDAIRRNIDWSNDEYDGVHWVSLTLTLE
jgi:hypothetical protein